MTEGYTLSLAIGDGLIDMVGEQNRTHWRIAGCQPFGDRHDIGNDALMLASKHGAGSAEACDHLIGDEENIELAAGGPHRGQPSLWRHDHPT